MMSEWRTVALGEVLSEAVKNGIYKPKEFHGSGTRIVNMGELFANDFISNQEMKQIRLSPEEKARFLVRDGDLLFARRSLVLEGSGRCALVVSAAEEMTFESSIIRVRPDPLIADSRFLFYSFRSPHMRAAMAAISTQTAVSGIRGSDLACVRVALPPLPIQRRIASILSAYDDLIENCERRIRVLDEMARALYREWFVHFRFPGHEKTTFVDSPMGRIPKGWEVRKVDEVIQRVPSGKKYEQKTVNPAGNIPVLDQGKSGIIGYHDDEPGVLASESSPVIVFANHTCYQRLIQFPFSAIQNVLPFLPNPLRARNIYWLHWATNGIVVFNDYKGHWPEFISKTLIVPTAEDCQRFGDIVAPISRENFTLEQRINNLRKTRDLLLPRLLSGQLPVEDLHETHPEESS